MNVPPKHNICLRMNRSWRKRKFRDENEKWMWRKRKREKKKKKYGEEMVCVVTTPRIELCERIKQRWQRRSRCWRLIIHHYGLSSFSCYCQWKMRFNYEWAIVHRPKHQPEWRAAAGVAFFMRSNLNILNNNLYRMRTSGFTHFRRCHGLQRYTLCAFFGQPLLCMDFANTLHFAWKWTELRPASIDVELLNAVRSHKQLSIALEM